MYYNIAVEVKGKDKDNRYYEFDQESLDDIMKYIINPFKEEKKIYINNRFINYSDIDQLQVFESVQKVDDLVSIAQRNLSRGIIMVYSRKHMLNEKNMKNITKDLLFS